MQKFINIFLFSLLISGLMAGPAGLRPAVAATVNAGVIKVNRANVRKTPHKQSPKIFSLQRQDKVQILKERDGWFYIVTDEGQCGWISGSLVKAVTAPAIKPEIKIFADSLTPRQKGFINGLVVRMQGDLAASEPRKFAFLISRIAAAGEKSEPVVVGSGSAGKSNPWLLVLRYPFSRKVYQRQHASELESAVVDLLLYQKPLQVLLKAREIMVAEIKKNPAVWSVSTPAANAVEALLVLRNENGDQVALSGFLEDGFPVFNDSLILEIHGFSPFSIRATIPANVTDFNKFDLPSPYLPNGNRSTAALAYDFFGFSY